MYLKRRTYAQVDIDDDDITLVSYTPRRYRPTRVAQVVETERVLNISTEVC